VKAPRLSRPPYARRAGRCAIAGAALSAVAASGLACAPPRRTALEPTRAGSHDLDSARELDRQGVRSFREGRFADAVRYFHAAFEQGGPSSELWNVARCEEHLDDPEAAAIALDQYLARPDLSLTDRADARREADALRAHPSTLTVTTRPAGAGVWIDGDHAPGVTPLSVAVGAGAHTIVVRRPGRADVAWRTEARLGRAILVTVDLPPAEK
jgi:hypothetical protein